AVAPTRLVRYEESDDRGNLFRTTDPPEGRLRDELLFDRVLLGLLATHGRVDDSRRHRTDPRPDRSEPYGFRLHETLDPPLRPRVGGAGVLDRGAERVLQPVEEPLVEGLVECLVCPGRRFTGGE